MTSSPGPVVQRELLIRELRAIRHARNESEREVAAGLDWSPVKVVQLEEGHDSISTADLDRLLDHYGVLGEDRRQLAERAAAAAEPGWWEPYRRHVADHAFFTYLQYENGADRIAQFQPLLMPGILQTSDYAATVLRHFYPAAGAERLDALVELRMQRQELLGGRSREFVLDESVLYRRIGGTRVMADQLRRLATAAQEPGVTVQVLPLAAGDSFGLRGPFGLLDFDDPLDQVLYLEHTPEGRVHARQCAETLVHRTAFGSLRRQALAPGPSAELVAAALSAATRG